MNDTSEFFALDILAEREPALLARIAQRLAWIGVEPERFIYTTQFSDRGVKVEILLSAPRERADLVVNQLKKLIEVNRVELRRAMIAMLPEGNRPSAMPQPSTKLLVGEAKPR